MTDQITRNIRNHWFPVFLAILGFCGAWGVNEITKSFKTMTEELSTLSGEVRVLNTKLENNVLITREIGVKMERNANETRKITTDIRERIVELEIKVRNLEDRSK